MAYIGLNNGYTYGVITLTQVQALTGMAIGDTCYCTTNNRIMTYDGTFWLCDDFVVMTNRSGSTLNQWDVVVAQQGGTANEISCTTTTVSNDITYPLAGNPSVVGVVVYSALNGAKCVVALKGNYSANINSPVAINLGDDLTTGQTAGKAKKNNGPYSQGVFAFATSTTSGALTGTVTCIIIPRKDLN